MCLPRRLSSEMNPMNTEHRICWCLQRAMASSRCRLQQFMRNTRGQSGVEFALLLPLMTLMIAGTIDLGQGLMIRRKVDQMAAMTSDIISQEESWSATAVKTVLSGTANGLVPFNATDLKIVVSILDVGKDGVATVSSSKAHQTKPLPQGSKWPEAIPTELVASGEQLVVTTVEYDSGAVITGLLSSLTGASFGHFTGTAIVRPRIGDSVELR